jgi:hypothetical protein
MNTPSVNTAYGSGVCAHSGASAYETFYVFEVGSVLRSQEFNAWALDKGLRFKRVLGSYEGKPNYAFIVAASDFRMTDMFRWLKGQESVLELGPLAGRGARPAKLIWLDSEGWYSGRPDTPLGRLYATTRDYALRQPGWTYDPETDTYFVAEDRGTN